MFSLILSILAMIAALGSVYYAHRDGNKNARFAWVVCSLGFLSDVMGHLSKI